MTDAPKPRRRCTTIHPNAVYTMEQLSRALGLRDRTTPRERKIGRLRAVMRGRKVFILGEWVLDWLRDGEATKAPQVDATV